MRNECSLISCLTEEQHSWLTCFPKHEERGPRFLPHRSHARWPAKKKVDAGAKEMRQHDQQEKEEHAQLNEMKTWHREDSSQGYKWLSGDVGA
jgi:hypothetical protein